MKTDPRGLINVNKPIDKRQVAFNSDDLAKLRQIFPENGAQTYLPGLLVKILLKQLEEKGINDFLSRISGGHYDYNNLVPDYELVRKEVS
jgi:hypothetical protein